jgi:hypothetical protein
MKFAGGMFLSRCDFFVFLLVLVLVLVVVVVLVLVLVPFLSGCDSV